MALQKQPININFVQGLDTKSDPKQVQIGKFLSLQNSIFTQAGELTKRNGFAALPALPDTSTTFLTTFNGNLTAIGNKIMAYMSASKTWVSKGSFQPVSLSAKPLSRSVFNQPQCDAVIATNGFVCTVWTEVGGGVTTYKYNVQDSVTNQFIVGNTVIPITSGTLSGSPRVFLLGGYFIIVFTVTITGTKHLQYVSVSASNPTMVSAATDIASNYIDATTLSWDGVVYENQLFIAYNTTAGGQQVEITYLNTNFILASPVSFAGSKATVMSMCVDSSTPSAPVIYAAFFDSTGATANAVAVNTSLHVLMTATQFSTVTVMNSLTCTAQNGVLQIVYTIVNAYTYDSGVPTYFLDKVAITLPATVTTGTVGATTTFIRSVGLASKASLYNGVMYMLATYSSVNQPVYLLIDLNANIIARFAYQNGGGYLLTGLPQSQFIGAVFYSAYLFKDLIRGTNKAQGDSNPAAVYTQTGVNLIGLTFTSSTLSISELGSNLNISGGFMYAYDGNLLTEENFHVYPDNIELTVQSTGGFMTVQDYFYQVIYQWTDAQGNFIYSAPSIPVKAASGSFSGSTNQVTLKIPTIRLTTKPDVKMVVYRWSTANEEYFQVTSLTNPLQNDKTVDFVTYIDTLADSSIIGNSQIYTTGGVLENIAPSACTAVTIFDTRLWFIEAEDQNSVGYTKQVIEGVPVEWNDGLTKYIAPNAGAANSTGPVRCLFPLDDKLILFKKDALYYINGSGPDNTGANSQYSEPIFITSTVGSVNQNSIVLTPGGLLFQSDKGIWRLGRDMSTSYIGAAVEAFNNYSVNSAVAVPGTNQVRFTLTGGVTLMYDYFFNEWGTFIGVGAVSSTIYSDLHTYVSPLGRVAQETPGTYSDSGNPVLMSFTTGWIKLAGLQGYQRFYFFYLLGQYFSPHKLNMSMAYDYSEAPSQMVTISPTNFSGTYGDSSPYGQESPYGGPGDLEQWRIFPTTQRCQAFQISMQEIFDPTLGQPPGQGLSLSGLSMIAGFKKSYFPASSSQSKGGPQ